MNKKSLLRFFPWFTCCILLAVYPNCQNMESTAGPAPGASQRDSSGASLSVLTFNVGLFELKAFGFSVVKPADFLKDRLPNIPGEIIRTNADIVGLQEIYFHDHQKFLTEQLKEHYPYHCYRRTKSVKVNNGLMILSKYPIEEVQYQPFREKGPFDERTVAQKGVLSCTIATEDFGPVRVVNIHPTAGGFLYEQDSPEIMRIREGQIREAYQVAEQQSAIPTIILGDFNTGPEIAEANYRFLIEKGYTDSYLNFCSEKGLPPQMTWDATISLNRSGPHATSISQRIDHIYLSPLFFEKFSVTHSEVVFRDPIVKTADGSFVHLSDHFGVLSEFSKK